MGFNKQVFAANVRGQYTRILAYCKQKLRRSLLISSFWVKICGRYSQVWGQKLNLMIRQLRKKLHISQTDFASRIGVSLRTVGSWERGES